MEKKGRLQGCPDCGCCMGKLKWENEKKGFLCSCLGVHILLFLVLPKLEAGAKIREAGRYRLSTVCLGPVAKEVVVWFTGLVAADGGSEFYCHMWFGYCQFVYSSLSIQTK